MQEACGSGLCPFGEYCFEEVCTEPDCLGVVCPLDMRCVKGSCTACPEGTVPGAGDTCLPAGDAGTPCTAGHQCGTGICADGVCCDTVCRDACQSCATGSCRPTAAGTDDAQCYGYACAGDGGCFSECTTSEDCDGAWRCDDTGRCVPRQQDGTPCGGGDECVSGHCVDGVCCNTACDDGCGTCVAPGQPGQCLPVAAGTTCRAAQGSCNPEETCTGASTVCPQDAFTPNGASCGTTVTEPWGTCVLPPTCASTGTRTRTVHTFSCNAGSCEEKETQEPGTCTANPTGSACGTPVYGSWSACNWASPCAMTATRTRTVTRSTCSASGTCTPQPATTETAPCTRVTDGVTCQATSTGAWSGCNYAQCANTAPDETRSVKRYACAAGACKETATTEKRACTRNAEGATCGTATYGGWGACGGYTGTCDNTGTRTRSKTQPTCKTGQCVNVTSQEQGSCSRNMDGTTCGSGTTYGSWGSCSYGSQCAQSGTEARSVSTSACSGGTCRTTTSSETRACSRSTQGQSCGAGTVTGSWGTCSYPSECATSGSRTRTVTTYRCSGGSCAGSNSTDTEACNRSTNGQSCGAGQTTSCGNCNTSIRCQFGTYGVATCTTTTRTCSGGACTSSTSSRSECCG